MSDMHDNGEKRPIEYTADEGSLRAGAALDACCNELHCELGEMTAHEPGRIIFVSLLLRAVRPGRRVALAVRLQEEEKTTAGLRTLLLPPHTDQTARDVLVKEIPFVLPERLQPDVGAQRRFTVQAWAHYMDTDAAWICALPQ